MDKRIFVKKRDGYNKEALDLKYNLNIEYNLGIKDLELYIIYDIYNINEKTYELAKNSVFSEVMIDEVVEDIILQDGRYFAYETLPAQYDQRADSAVQCVSLLDNNSKITVRSGKLIIFDRVLNQDEMDKVKKYLVNPIESRVKDLSILSFSMSSEMKKMKDLKGFSSFSKDELIDLKNEMSLAMNIEDLIFIQDYFRNEGRIPTETEIYVLDCYWSDHCRHTTFETVLDDIKIESELFQKEMQNAFDIYLNVRKELNITKPITLMDMASIFGKYHKRVLNDQNIEVSEEINACSFFTDIENNGKIEKWLIQFKNETHNHPTEIEPFGGASTCVGGAIRDPLSGRSYVYQAMRVTGCGNILQKREETLKHKLPQVDISTKATSGYSSYGNQIGLATTYVKELYDDSYVAKHMEVGAVVGAVKYGDFKRETPVKDDIVILIGGRTGRDGIQGASGSSLIHTNDSLETASSQVQKGNAIEERKIQRLFRKPEVTKLIKKCNDFGAGGVCVAIGELSDGIEIHLDKVLLKYEGLNPTEIATSESQERMAIVISPNDYEIFIKECEKENIEYSKVATITDRRRLEMYYYDDKVMDLSADFLATSGVRQHSKATLCDNDGSNPFENKLISKENVLNELSSLNVACQKGIAQRFDASIGATTVLMPFSGKNQLTPVQAGIQALPTIHSTSDTATILSYGFIPKISHYSPFLSAIYAVLESVAKVYAVGGDKSNLYFSFQEYFEKLGKDSKKWGKVTQSLLGTIYAQNEIGCPSIGGKDSMSGTFNELNVVETLISFACTPVKIKNVISPELKTIGNYIYYVPIVKNSKGYPEIKETLKSYELINELIKSGKILSAYVQEEGSVVSSLVKMAVGNGLGFTVNKENILNFDRLFPHTQVIKLEQNYRSDGNILAAANGVIQNNLVRRQKKLWTQKEEGAKIRIEQYENAVEEANQIIREIKANAKEGNYNDFAILYRTNAQSRLLEERCVTLGVPYQLVGGVNFYQRKEIKDILAYLKTVANGSDDIALLRIMNVPKRGIGNASIQKVSAFASANGLSLYEAIREVSQIAGMGKAAEKFQAFSSLIEQIRQETGKISTLIERLIVLTGYKEYLSQEGEIEAQARWENIEELINKAADYTDLSQFLEDVALIADVDRMDENEKRVTLMTLHAAKGLEFPYVYLTGMEDGLFPGIRSIASEDRKDLEEERRLCYVGITRAKKKLCLTAARMRMVNGETRFFQLSRFAKEIPNQLIEQHLLERKNQEVKKKEPPILHSVSHIARPSTKPSFGKEFKIEKAEHLEYIIGDRVKHMKFGEGTVLTIEDGERDYTITVEFDQFGIKKMMAGFAKLIKI